MSRAKPAVVRFYLDADVLGLAHVVAGVRSDATYPGDPAAIIKRRERSACPIADPATKDDVWIPQVASLGWLIITRDSRIQQHRAEIAAVKASNARMVALSGDEARGTWQQLEVLMKHWRAIDELTDEAGPFIYTAKTRTIKAVDLGPVTLERLRGEDRRIFWDTVRRFPGGQQAFSAVRRVRRAVVTCCVEHGRPTSGIGTSSRWCWRESRRTSEGRPWPGRGRPSVNHQRQLTPAAAVNAAETSTRS